MLRGEGSNLAMNFIQASISAYKKRQPAVTLTYLGLGSPRGSEDLADGKVDFAVVDGAQSAAAVPADSQSGYLYFPMVASPIAIAFNVPGIRELRMSPETISRIFQGAITRWDAPRLKAENPGITLPNLPVVVAHPTEPSGTTQNFASFVSRAAPISWTFGAAPSLQWPVNAAGARGDLGVAQIVTTTPGAVGYVDYANARALTLDMASVENVNGEYVAPSLDSSSAALEGVSVNADLTFDPLNATGPGTYPITAASWLVVDAMHLKPAKATALRGFLRFVYNVGRPIGEIVNAIAPTPNVVDLALTQVASIRGT
jgi:phosphate transport system substrate-binding protein